MKDFSITLIVIVVILILLLGCGLAYLGGAFDVFYEKTITKEMVNVQRENFESSTAYVKGMVSDLAKYKYEFETEKDTTAKKAIINLIVSKFADFSPEKIDDLNTRQFLIDIKSGKYNNLEGK